MTYSNSFRVSSFIVGSALGLGFVLEGSGYSKDPASEAKEPPITIFERGRAIYAAQCASCHGVVGEGVKQEHESPLLGDLTVGELTNLITETMPKDDPSACKGDDAVAVSTFIHEAFYSEAAQIRNRPPRVGLARLTGAQLRQSLADLYASLDGVIEPQTGQGLRGAYFDGSRSKDDKKRLERIDPTLDFDFGKESPVEGVAPTEFAIFWDGGLKIDASGKYELIVESTCSFVMDFGKIGRRFFDNHVQSGDKTIFRKSVQLTAGRVYPIKIEFIQRKRKTEQPPARISLRWIPPHGNEEVIPAHSLIPVVGPPVFSLQTNLPPDDRSYGYDRGIAISRQWDESVTAAVLEFCETAIHELWPRYREKHRKETSEGRTKLRTFLVDLVERGLREPLSDELKAEYVDGFLEATPDDSEAIKLVLLAALKSPRFLYTEIGSPLSESQVAAKRMALTLMDSAVVDDGLRLAASKNQLGTPEEVRAVATRLLDDYRVQAKLRSMIHEWLALGPPSDLAKDGELYPGFDTALAADLYDSLEKSITTILEDDDCDYRRLFSTDWVYTTPRMVAFYGEAWRATSTTPLGDRTEPLPEHRFGVLTHPYLMSRLAYHNATSPIHRGVFLIRYLLGRNLKPPNEAFTPLSPELHPGLTTRERVSLQTQADNCQACHIKINGLGFTLENFDAVGRFRLTERGKPVDPSGSYLDRAGELIELQGVEALAKYLMESDDAHRAFVGRVFQHFVKQPIAAFGEDRLDQLTRQFVADNFNIRKLVVEVAVVAACAPTKR